MAGCLVQFLALFTKFSEGITKTRLFKYIENFTTIKFSDKNSDIFLISAHNIAEEVLTSTHNLCFWAEIRKIMYTSVNTSFTI